MDDRQSGIKEGAGLEDSRVNQEFLDFLNKWSSPVLLTLAVAALVWAGLQHLERKKVARVNQAFSELESATAGGNPSPASLKTLASEYEGVRSVSSLALLTTSDVYLNAFVVGFEPGAQMDQVTGLPLDENDVLTDEKRQVYLDQAGQLAKQVLEENKNVEGKELLAMQAISRVAAYEEGKRNYDGAKSMYQQLESTATTHKYPSVVAFAQTRIANLDSLKDIKPLLSLDSFGVLPGESPQLTQEQLQEMLNSVPEIESDPIEEAPADNGVDSSVDETESESEPIESESP